MPIVRDNGDDCCRPKAGSVVKTELCCNDECECTTYEPPAHEVSGKTSCAPSSACHESFRGTTRAQAGHLLVKESPGDKCLHHLSASEEAFIVTDCDRGSKLTRSPEVDVPSAQGYETTVMGRPLLDENGCPVLGETPEFSKLWISGVVDAGEHKLFTLHAPNSDVPLHLVAENGCFRFASESERSLCSDILPEKVELGRLLLVDKEPDCVGERWCVKELNLPLEEQQCVWLTVTQDEEGYTQIGYVEPPIGKGFIKVDPDNPCGLVVQDPVLDEDDLAQFKGWMEQVLCEETLPEDECSSVEIDRIIGCGSRSQSECDTDPVEGVQGFTIRELYRAIDVAREEDADPDVVEGPTTPDGDPIIEDLLYNVVWDSEDEKFYYIQASRMRLLNMPQMGLYEPAPDLGYDDSTSTTATLASYGINVTHETHVEMQFDLQCKGLAGGPRELFCYVNVGSTRVAQAGAEDTGAGLLNPPQFNVADSSSIRAFIPIVNGTITWTWGMRSDPNTESRIRITARAVAIHSLPAL